MAGEFFGSAYWPNRLRSGRYPLDLAGVTPEGAATEWMSGLFYNLGRRLGHAAVPAIRRGRWIWTGLTGSEVEQLHAEAALGAALAAELEETLPAGGDPGALRLIQAIGSRLMEAIEQRERRFRFEIVQSDSPNAMALPGGYVFLSLSLVDLCERSPDELAFVIGHEMAHVMLGHAWDRMVNQSALNAASIVLGRAGPLGPWLRQNGLRLLRSAHARKGEFEADALGWRLAQRAGYDSEGARRLLGRVARFGPDPDGLGQYFASHPPAEERRAQLGQKSSGLGRS